MHALLPHSINHARPPGPARPRFAKELDPEVSARSPEGLARMRELCERALTAGGLHVAEGGRLWGAYRGWVRSARGLHGVRLICIVRHCMSLPWWVDGRWSNELALVQEKGDAAVGRACKLCQGDPFRH